jgi:selenide,water dikinase
LARRQRGEGLSATEPAPIVCEAPRPRTTVVYYAMGGRPLAAMNLVCFPRGQIPMEVLKEILLGGIEVIREAGAFLVGGHSVEDPELKYGLSVTGTVHPDEVVTNAGAQPGDRLVLTKPLGTGILATAIKGRMLSSKAEQEAVQWMTTLNRSAAEAMQAVGCHACTDITGFGLLWHTLEMAVASGVQFQIGASRLESDDSLPVRKRRWRLSVLSYSYVLFERYHFP